MAPRTVAATRDALHGLAARPGGARVVGFVDLTSPHLIDLLDELVAGPGGRCLWGIGTGWPSVGTGWLDDLSVRRGLACLHERGLALVVLGPGPAGLVDAVTEVEPGLAVVHDRSAPATSH